MKETRNVRGKKFLLNRGGYLTIEVSMVFSVLFFSLILILYMGIILYQEVSLQSLAVRSSERGSIVYSSRVADMTTGIKTLADFQYRDPYRNVPLISRSGDGTYQNLVDQYVKKYLNSNNVLEGDRGDSSVTIINNILSKRVKVNVSNSYRLPVESIGTMFGHEGPFDVNTAAASAVVDSPDFVRNVDLTLDVMKQSGILGPVEEGYNKIMDALEEVKGMLQ